MIEKIPRTAESIERDARIEKLLATFPDSKSLGRISRLSTRKLKEIKKDLDSKYPGDEQITEDDQLQKIYVTVDSEL